MGDRRPVPGGIQGEVRAAVTLCGVLAEQPIPDKLPGKECFFCEITVQVGNHDFPVRLYGDPAELAGEIPAGTGVLIEGRLSLAEWKTGGGKRRQRKQILITGKKIAAATPPPGRIQTRDVP